MHRPVTERAIGTGAGSLARLGTQRWALWEKGRVPGMGYGVRPCVEM